jgi:hypothetical protein
LTYEALAKWIRGYSGFKCLFFAPLRLCVRFWLCRPSSAFLQTIPELRHFFRRLPSSFFLHAFCIAVLALFSIVAGDSPLLFFGADAGWILFSDLVGS